MKFQVCIFKKLPLITNRKNYNENLHDKNLNQKEIRSILISFKATLSFKKKRINIITTPNSKLPVLFDKGSIPNIVRVGETYVSEKTRI